MADCHKAHRSAVGEADFYCLHCKRIYTERELEQAHYSCMCGSHNFIDLKADPCDATEGGFLVNTSVH
jgi:hypothetical protein